MQTIGSIARFFRLRSPYPVAAVLLTVLLAGPAGGVAAAFAQTFQTSAPHAILIDSASGSVLFEKDADALVVPASTAKIMTAEIVFHEIALGHLKLDDQFVVSETAWRYGGAPSRGSSMFAAPNSQIRIEDLIRGLVIELGQRRGNRACRRDRRIGRSLRHAHDETRARAWPRAFDLYQRMGQGRPGAKSDP